MRPTRMNNQIKRRDPSSRMAPTWSVRPKSAEPEDANSESADPETAEIAATEAASTRSARTSATRSARGRGSGARAVRPQPAASSASTNQIAVWLFFLSLTVPLIIYLGPVRLSAYRLLLLAVFIPLLYGWVSGRAGPILRTDIYVILLSAWAVFSLFVLHGVGASIEFSGAFVAETAGAYLLGRTYVRTPEAFRSMARILFLIVCGIAPLAAYEMLTAHNVVLEMFGKIGPVFPDVYKEPRWGLDRVQGPFEHPILFGVFCGASVALTHYVVGAGRSVVGRYVRTGLALFTCVVAFSAGPLTAVMAQVMLIGWNIVLNKYPWRWWALLAIVIMAWVAVSVVSTRTPPEVFIQYFSFSQSTAYNRINIWEFGSASVLNFPLFGVGLGEWARPIWMSGSMDMYWLVMAVRYGMPGGLLMMAVFLSTFIGTAFREIRNPLIQEYRLGALFVLCGFFLAGWTTHYWNATYVLFFFLIGSTQWFRYYDSEAAVETPTEERRTKPRVAIGALAPK